MRSLPCPELVESIEQGMVYLSTYARVGRGRERGEGERVDDEIMHFKEKPIVRIFFTL